VADPPERHPDVLARLAQRPVRKPPGGGPRQRADDREERRLPRAVRPEDHRDLARLEPRAHADERAHWAIGLRDRSKLHAPGVLLGHQAIEHDATASAELSDADVPAIPPTSSVATPTVGDLGAKRASLSENVGIAENLLFSAP
jgi:hypothetical protein